MPRNRNTSTYLSTQVGPKPPTRVRRGVWRQTWRSRALYLFLLPGLAGMLLFQYYPAISAFYHAFYKWDGRRATFVGLLNFRFFLSDSHLTVAWLNIIKLLAFRVIVVVTVPVLAAYFIFRLPKPSHRYFYRVLFVIPIVVPGVVSVMLWKWFYSLHGAINFALESVGLGSWTRLWLGDFDTALYALMFMGFPWVGGVTMLIYLAGLMSIPREVQDAALVDGASGFKRFWFVELPLIQGQIKLQVMLTVIGGLQEFYRIQIMTDGGPGWATMVPGLHMFHAYQHLDLGYASAIGLMLFVLIFSLTMINQRYIHGSVEVT
ncbi:MAG: sugar ABC transporter permease [Anaerolineae bacterium]|nr:sugar ABC transporter permease [Anaerolineae bacterium]